MWASVHVLLQLSSGAVANTAVAAIEISRIADLRHGISQCSGACTFEITKDLSLEGREIELRTNGASITIQGLVRSGGEQVTLDAHSLSRFFTSYHRDDIHLQLRNLRLQNGYAFGTSAYGGAIYIKAGNRVIVDLENVTLAHNSVDCMDRGQGGAVHVGGDFSILSAVNSKIVNNSVQVASDLYMLGIPKVLSISKSAAVNPSSNTTNVEFSCIWGDSCEERNPWCSQSEEICETECGGNYGVHSSSCSSGNDGLASGGALSIYGRGAQLVLTDSLFEVNAAIVRVAGTATAKGGAVSVMGTDSSAVVTRTLFSSNTVRASGEFTVHTGGGAMYVELPGSATIHQVNFSSVSDTVAVTAGRGTGGETQTDKATDAEVSFTCDARYYMQRGVGYDSVGGMQACALCNVGQYLNTTATGLATSCFSCPVGRYGKSVLEPGASLESYCLECPAGMFNGVQAATSCSNCTVGFVAEEPEASACVTCKAGFFAGGEGGATCRSCEPGFYSMSNATTGVPVCQACDAGHFSRSAATTCLLCYSGQYQSAPASAGCINCPMGKYRYMDSGSEQQDRRTLADATTGGLSSNSITSSGLLKGKGKGEGKGEGAACGVCGVGQYSASEGSSTCSVCEAGQFAARNSSRSCQVCGRGWYSDTDAAATCTMCAKGHYGVQVGARNSSCSGACPTGVECPQGTAANTVVVDGYIYEIQDGKLVMVGPEPVQSKSGVLGDAATQWVLVIVIGSMLALLLVFIIFRKCLGRSAAPDAIVRDCKGSNPVYSADKHSASLSEFALESGVKTTTEEEGPVKRASMLGKVMKKVSVHMFGSGSSDSDDDSKGIAVFGSGAIVHPNSRGSRDNRKSSSNSSGGAGDTERDLAFKVSRECGLEYTIPVDKLELVQVIGTGASGCVHSAMYYDQEVAVKELMLGPLSEEERAIVFAQAAAEVKLLSQLHHPAIVRLIGTAMSETGRLMIVTERCDMDLKEFLATQPQCVGHRDFETWHSLMRQICGGMAFLHDNNIIHRDLKPGNCLVNLADQVRICDFGLSVRSRLKERDETHTGYAGTPLYMAPEMMCAESVRYSGMVDVFSFGVLMYQCWTGKRPYDEIRGPVWKVQRHILDGGRPKWKDTPQCTQMQIQMQAQVQAQGLKASHDESMTVQQVKHLPRPQLSHIIGSLVQLQSSGNKCVSEPKGAQEVFGRREVTADSRAGTRANPTDLNSNANVAANTPTGALTPQMVPQQENGVLVADIEPSDLGHSPNPHDPSNGVAATEENGITAKMYSLSLSLTTSSQQSALSTPDTEVAGTSRKAYESSVTGSMISDDGFIADALEAAVIALASQCWATDPNDRPTFHEISKQLGRIDTGGSYRSSGAQLP